VANTRSTHSGVVKTFVGAATEGRPYNNAREDMEMEQSRDTISKNTCDR